MEFSLNQHESGSLECRLENGRERALILASDPPAALADFAAALEALISDGYGECFWYQPSGEHRWMFRRAGEKLRLMVLWSTGVVTGWEHVFYAECDLGWFVGSACRELESQRITAL
jgi:hypothetical protein